MNQLIGNQNQNPTVSILNHTILATQKEIHDATLKDVLEKK